MYQMTSIEKLVKIVLWIFKENSHYPQNWVNGHFWAQTFL